MVKDMRCNKIISFCLIPFLLIFMISQSLTIIESNSNYDSERIIQSTKSLIDIDVINIDSDEDFDSYGFQGNGTVSNPYLIENYNINSPYSFGISIEFTTMYFEIKNCLITASSRGIELQGVETNTAKIIGNTFSGQICGIVVYTSESTVIANNTFDNRDIGIWIESSAYSIIANNTFNRFGIRVYFDEWCHLSECLSYNIYNNFVKEKPIGWFKNKEDLSFVTGNYEQIFLVNCTNITIKNQESRIETENFVGIGLYFCQHAEIIENNCGIDVFKGNNVEISNNHFSNTFIHISLTSSTKIENNICMNGYFKMYLSNLAYAIVRNNILGFNKELYIYAGIHIYDSIYCTIDSNEILNNKEYGIIMSNCAHITLRNNKLYNNEKYGIYIKETNECSIYNNIFNENTIYGIYVIENSANNKIYSNIFTKNGDLETTQAYDDGTSNFWYNTSLNEGNYWDDRFGDIYFIDGAAGSADPYPLSDTDFDGMPAEWEIFYDLDPWNDDSDEDADFDNLTNLEEYQNETNPKSNDTDSDNLMDGDEVLIYFTDPNNNDTDNDGYSDGDEIKNGSDPLDPNSPSLEKSSFNIYYFAFGILLIVMYIKKKRE